MNEAAELDISVVVPVYNEIESVDMLCEQLHAAMSKLNKSYEILLIDDGSTDGTFVRLTELIQRFPGFKVIRFRRNFGQTAAMSAGFKESRGEIIITLDADLQNDPVDIPLLISKMDEGFDVVSGWRKNRQDTFVNRKLPSIIANNMISRITGVHLHDYGCTLKAYRRDVVKNLHLYGDMHRFIPALASWVGGQIAEVEVNHHARRFGTSKYGISRTWKVLLDLITVKFLVRYSAHPIQMFGKIGAFFGVPGLLMVVAALGAHIGYNFLGMDDVGLVAKLVDIFKRPTWVILPFMLIFFFVQFITMGLLAEIQIRTYHESQQKPIYVIREIRKSPGPA
jgi:glycosyltransferase involved in cell wall biosynthesis